MSRCRSSDNVFSPAKISAVNLLGKIPLIKVKVGDHECIALLDSGATKSLISKKLFSKLKKQKCVKGVTKISNYMETANGAKIPIRQELKLHIKIDNFSWDYLFWVANEIPYDMILAYDFFHFSKLSLNMTKQVLKFNYGSERERVLFLLDEDNLKSDKMQFEEAEMSDEVRENFQKLLRDYGDVVTGKIGKAKVAPYKLRVSKDIKPFRMRPFQMTPDKVRAMREIINELLSSGVIEKSQSEFSSNCFLVPKREKGKFRLVNNYKTLNQYIEMDSFPSPTVDSTFQYLQSAKFFTSIDLVHSFFQLELSKSSRKYTAFSTSFGSYQWVRVPQGLKIGTQALNRVVDEVLGDLKFKCVINFCDDVLIYSPDEITHYNDVKAVLQKLREYNLTVNPDKLKLAKRGVQFLGHYVSDGKLHLDPSRIEPIKNYPVPKTVKQVQRFVGLASFYNKFIPNFSEICYPLNRLKRKGVKFKWTKLEQASFEKLIEALTSPPVLHLPDFSKKFILSCDASDHSIGCVLQQERNSTLVVIAYTSRALQKNEQAYSIYKRELLACLWGCERYREFLLDKPFILRTDNQAITYLWKSDKTTGQLARWKLRLSEFPCEIEHARATQNIPADALSRLFEPTPEAKDKNVKPEHTVHFLQHFPEVFHDIGQKQREDLNLREIIVKLEKGEVVNNFLLRNGVLKYQKNKNCAPKICVPESLKQMVLKFNHDTSLSAHWGIKKTTAKIAKDFAWKSMFEDIRHYVRSCKLCQLHKISQNTKVGLMSSTLPERSMQRLHIDLFGPLVRSKTGNQYMLVCVDSFSKFTWFIPLKKATSETVIKAMTERIFAQNGIAEIVISDNGSQFTSNRFRSFLFGLGIKHITTSVARPQGNQSERENRNLKYALKIFHSQTQNRWDENLNFLMIGINSAHHESIGMTPAMALMGRELNNPLQLAWNLVEKVTTTPTQSIEDRVSEILKNLKSAQNRMKKAYDKNRRPSPYKIGDQVLYRVYIPSDKAKKISNKLSQGWKGPWTIFEVLNDVNVRIKLNENPKIVRVVHVAQLKRFYDR